MSQKTLNSNELGSSRDRAGMELGVFLKWNCFGEHLDKEAAMVAIIRLSHAANSHQISI